MLIPAQSHEARSRRRGAVTTWLVVIALIALLPVLFIALDTHRQMTTKVYLQTAADAAARAAARTLVHDFLLLDDTTVLRNQLAASAGDAGRLAACTTINRRHSVLLQTAGPPDADIVFGRLETVGGRNFDYIDPS